MEQTIDRKGTYYEAVFENFRLMLVNIHKKTLSEELYFLMQIKVDGSKGSPETCSRIEKEACHCKRAGEARSRLVRRLNNFTSYIS